MSRQRSASPQGEMNIAAGPAGVCEVTVEEGASLSGALDNRGLGITGLFPPATWKAAATKVGFYWAPGDDTNTEPDADAFGLAREPDGTPLACAVTPGDPIYMQGKMLFGGWVKLQSRDDAGNAVAQDTDQAWSVLQG